MRRILASFLMPMALLACSSSDDAATTVPTSAAPATAAPSTTTTPAATDAQPAPAPPTELPSTEPNDALSMGDSAPVEKGVLTIAEPAIVQTDSGAALQVQVTLEAGDGEGKIPNIGLLCAGSDSMGTYLGPSTIALGDTVPAGTATTGTLVLLLPTDMAACAPPAYVVGEVNGAVDTLQMWPLDDALAAAVTAS